MNPEKWEQIKQLLGSALEQEPGRRDAFLRAACGSDDALRGELEALLAAYDSEKSVSTNPLTAMSGDAAEGASGRPLAGNASAQVEILEIQGAEQPPTLAPE